VTCTRCGAQNREGRKFCSECGAVLALPCPSCGAANEPGEKFCGECGLSLGASLPPATTMSQDDQPRPTVAERRLVSVLFADLVGFTSLSESRDPEEVRELLSTYFDIARQNIVRYGGQVEKFIGDAVMAVWGTPVAHEDDAERAVRAALELVDEITALGAEVGMAELRLRAGVLTGEAAVTLGAAAEGMVAGDLVNTASRLQSAAAPRTVLVGRSTYLAARKAIAFEEAGSHVLKGKSLPVEAHRALRVTAGHGGFRKSGQAEPPFMGRADELRLLKDLFNVTAREKRPRLVSVMGIAGIGKSRLAWEFFKYIDGVVDVVYWHQGRCPAYGEGVTFWALGEMVKMRAGIAETEDPRSSRDKLARAVEDYVSDPEEQSWIEPRLAHLLGLEEVSVAQREELFAAWRAFFEHISDKAPSVLVFEDLQWADQGLIDFVEYLLEWARSHPIFIVVLARPELTDKRPTWGAAQRNFVSLALEPLVDEAMAELLKGLATGIPQEVLARIVERAEGVPLYAVETIRMLVDQGSLVAEGGSYRLVGSIDKLAVPDTLHALIASRLDALAEDDRRLLQDASVLGKTFTLQALAGVTSHGSEELEPRLRRLARKELLDIEADPRSPERGQYGFVSGLIREVAYHTLSRHDRKTRHLAAAHFFEASADEELASVVAAHYIEAYRSLPEGPEAEALAARARDSLVTAAERASSLGSNEEALGYLRQAITVTPSDEERISLLERAAEAAHAAGDYRTAESYLEQAIEWHQEHHDRPAAARATARLGRVLIGDSRVEPAFERLQEALAELQGTEASLSKVEVSSELARAFMLKGEPGRALEWADRALAGAEELDLVMIIAESLITKGVAAYLLGRWREAIVLLEGASALADEHHLAAQGLRAQSNLSMALSLIDPVRGLESGRACLETARKLGMAEWEEMGAANASWSALGRGEWDWARDVVGQLYGDELPVSQRAYLGQLIALFDGFRGDVFAARSRLEDLEALLSATSTSPQDLAELRVIQSWIELAGDAVEKAHARAMLAVSCDPGGASELHGLLLATRAALWLSDRERAGAALYALDATKKHGPWLDCARRTLRAGLLALDGSREEAASSYADVAVRWRDLGVPFDLALSHLDFLALVGPEHPHGAEAAEEAREIFTRLRAQPFLDRLESFVSRQRLGLVQTPATSERSP